MSTWAFFALLGIGTGALYGALACGVIVAYRGSGVVNFAVGAMAMIPAITFAELRATGDLVLPLIIVPSRYDIGDPLGLVPAGALALVVGTAVSLAIYLCVIRPLRGTPQVTMLVATVGLTIALQALAVKSFGNRTIRSAGILPDDVITVLGRPYPVDRLWVAGVVVMLTIVVHIVMVRTRFGLATRAAFLNEKGAVLLGFDPIRIGLYNWMVAATIGAVIGILASSLGGVSPFNFSLYVVPALGAALAARLSSYRVAVLAGIAIGAFEAVAVHIVSQQQVPRFFLGGISSLVPFAVIVLAVVLVGQTLPNRAALVERASVPVERVAWKPLLWVGVIAATAVALVSSDATVRFSTIQSVYVMTLLLSIVVLTGFVGQVSLAQLSFAGFSAFMLSRFDETLPFPFGPLAAIAVTTLLGTLVGIPALRVRGIQFAIVTFAVAVVLDELLFRSPSFVGVGGLATVEPPTIAGVDLGITGQGSFPSRRFGLLMLVVAVACAALVHSIRRGQLGRRFLAVRSNERAAAASGINVPRTKVLAAAVASFIAAIAGVMFAYKSTTFTGAGLDAQEGLELLALAYLGGIGSIAGAVIGGFLAPSGALAVIFLGGGSTIDQFLFTGVALMVVAIRFPSGLAGAPASLRHRIERARSDRAPVRHDRIDHERPRDADSADAPIVFDVGDRPMR
ncbi:MAG: ABC transporter permease [Ilumatobacter sp.]|jgi:branched-chain amino acid transport system permease protein|uniref:ABC transporter permease n=1 Tax=Ilumatobacter sp. TaxID=1967498 RepID=UPI00391B9AAA